MDRGQITRKSYESNHIFFSSRRELSNPRRELKNSYRISKIKHIYTNLYYFLAL